MKQEQIDRINELARKSKVTELTPEEKEEQKKLRTEYIATMPNWTILISRKKTEPSLT